MTVEFIKPWNSHSPGSSATFPANVEADLVSLGIAVAEPGNGLAPVMSQTDASGATVLVVGGAVFPMAALLEESPRLDTFHRYVIGDGPTAVSVAASAATVSHPIDMRGQRFSDATLHVILTGTGTGKATIEGSQDGVTNWYSMGDLLTGMVASPGSYILRMDATGLNDWDYLRVTVTETGGANAVSVKVRLYADSANKNATVFAYSLIAWSRIAQTIR